MQNLNERLRRFVRIMEARSERAVRYWDMIPPYRLGDLFLDKMKELIECLTTGKGDVTEHAVDTAFMCFLISERGDQLRTLINRAKGGMVSEITIDPNKEREKADRKAWKKKKGKGEDWRG